MSRLSEQLREDLIKNLVAHDWTKREVLKNFVVIEGIDGSGKTTLCRGIFDEFFKMGVFPRLTKEPSERISIYNYSLNFLSPEEKALIFAFDRLANLKPILGPWGVSVCGCVQRGELVIQDRYFFSSLAYQWGLYSDNVNAIFPLPELLIYLRCPPDLAGCRIVKRGDQTPDMAELKLVSDAYEILLGERGLYSAVILDATQPVEELTAQAVKAIKESVTMFKEARGGTD